MLGRLAVHLESHQPALDPVPPDSLQGFLADEPLLGLDLPLQPQFVQVGRQIHVRLIIENAGLNAAGVVRAGGDEAEGLPAREDERDHLLHARIVQAEHLIPHLAGPAGAGDDHRDAAREFGFHQPVVAQRLDAVADEGQQDVRRFWTLDLHRVDIGELHRGP